jgi:hypothetical protein
MDGEERNTNDERQEGTSSPGGSYEPSSELPGSIGYEERRLRLLNSVTKLQIILGSLNNKPGSKGFGAGA